MNILFVSSEFPENKFSPTGGIGTYLVNLCTQLVKSGHKVTLITRGRGKIYSYKSIDVIQINCRIISIKFKGINIISKFFSFIEYPVIFSLKSAMLINKVVKKNDIDLIECSDFCGDLWFYLLNPFIKKIVPVVVRLHTPYFVISKFNNDYKGITNKILTFFEKTQILLADSVYSPSKNLAKLVQRETGKKINVVIPYPFNPKYKKSILVKREKWTILYVGKLQYKKGVFKLLKAVQLLKNKNKSIFCYFIGLDTIINTNWISNLMKNKALEFNISNNIKIINKNIGKKQLFSYFKKSSALVVPSLWENFPNVILEAFQLGTPVVAASVGGIPEMIKDGYNGLLYSSSSSTQLGNSVFEVLKNPRLANNFSRNAYKKLRTNYNSKKVTKQTLSYYQTVLNSVSQIRKKH